MLNHLKTLAQQRSRQWPQPVADRVLKTFAFLIKEYDENSAAAHAWETVVLVRKGVFVGLSTGFLVLKSPAAQLVA